MGDNYPINRDTLMTSEICGDLDRLYRSRLDHYEDTDPLGLSQRFKSDLEAAGWQHDGLPVTREPTGASRGLAEVLECYAARYAEEANAAHQRKVSPESVSLAAPTVGPDPRLEPLGEEVAALAATVSFPGLRPRDPILISALVTCPSKAAAARVAGVSRTTVYERLKDPLFREAYEAVRFACMTEAMASARDGLALGASEAVDALRSIVRDPWASSADRTRAATQLLNYHLLTKGSD